MLQVEVQGCEGVTLPAAPALTGPVLSLLADIHEGAGGWLTGSDELHDGRTSRTEAPTSADSIGTAGDLWRHAHLQLP